MTVIINFVRTILFFLVAFMLGGLFATSQIDNMTLTVAASIAGLINGILEGAVR